MAYSDKEIVKDKNRYPAPGYWNENANQFEVAMGENGAVFMKQVGNTVEEYWEGTSDITKTFSKPMSGVSIANDGLQELKFTINGQERTLYPGEPYNGNLKPFTQIIIKATDKYRAEVLT
jgi:hypothetical protein